MKEPSYTAVSQQVGEERANQVEDPENYHRQQQDEQHGSEFDCEDSTDDDGVVVFDNIIGKGGGRRPAPPGYFLFVLGMIAGGLLVLILSISITYNKSLSTTVGASAAATPPPPIEPCPACNCDCDFSPLQNQTKSEEDRLKQQSEPTSSSSSSSSLSKLPSGGSSTPSQTASAAVSYSFLQTTKGQKTLKELLQVLETRGPREVLVEVGSLMEEDDQVAASCHPLTHRIGRRALQLYGYEDSFGDMPGTPDDSLLHTCNAAYMHGIIEHYLLNSTSLTSLQQDAAHVEETLCGVLNEGVEQGVLTTLPWECRHGIGHGILQQLQQTADYETLKSSLSACANSCSFVRDISAKDCLVYARTCQNGVWMDYFTSSVALTAMSVDPKLTQICTSMPGNMITDDCFYYVPTAFLLHNPQEYAAAIDWCIEGFGLTRQEVEEAYDDKNDTVNNATYRVVRNPYLETCIGGVGGQVAKENLKSLFSLQQTCLTAPSAKLQSHCFTLGLTYHTLSSGKVKFDKAVCDAVTNAAFLQSCLDHSE
eukprot:CAMPEP_0113443382 /NCGR_PEP_ID=MMETSP0014_2-20120614/2111_1 /TAXON_ID=2857 /ORGANISM="Nitzschia sp." /LENGTH=536 /DNA_ID=CAMNT_0000334339 /DNA_START=118 /DNA_END=1728 /DNA_ORIENTATION=- /assembly_acc=CAM_ASM_000159